MAPSTIVPGQYIVSLRSYATADMETKHVSRVRKLTEDPAVQFSCDVQTRFELPELRGYCAKFDEDTKTKLEEMDEVLAIEPVQIYRHCATQSNAPWGLARLSARKKLAASGPYQYKYTATGEGSVAYVIDTGINDTHEEFEGRASKGPKFVTSDTPVGDEDKDGHGTHVAGTIAGKTYGVAKKARVVGVKVFNDDPEPGAMNSDIISALDWVVKDAKEHGQPSVVNMSLGGGASELIDKAVAAAVRSGVIVCVAAGNDPSEKAEEGSPSREPLAITVGATDVSDVAAPWMSWGKIVDILAPGVNILSSWIGSTTATNTISGTSMACPHVTGVVCLWLGKENKEALLAMPELLVWADKNKITKLKDRTINALLQSSEN